MDRGFIRSRDDARKEMLPRWSRRNGILCTQTFCENCSRCTSSTSMSSEPSWRAARSPSESCRRGASRLGSGDGLYLLWPERPTNRLASDFTPDGRCLPFARVASWTYWNHCVEVVLPRSARWGGLPTEGSITDATVPPARPAGLVAELGKEQSCGGESDSAGSSCTWFWCSRSA